MILEVLEQPQSEVHDIIRWRKNCIQLMDSALRSNNSFYKIFALRFTARYFYLQGNSLIACRLLEKSIDLCQDKKIYYLINQDLVRYSKDLQK